MPIKLAALARDLHPHHDRKDHKDVDDRFDKDDRARADKERIQMKPDTRCAPSRHRELRDLFDHKNNEVVKECKGEVHDCGDRDDAGGQCKE